MTTPPAMNAGVYAELDGTPDAPSHARELVEQALGSHHPSVADAALIVSELVGNAVLHSHSGQPGGVLFLGVETTADPGDIRIQVRDEGGLDTPSVTVADADSEHGRGLAIVTDLAAEWGSQATPAGRTTWTRISHRQHAADQARTADREAC